MKKKDLLLMYYVPLGATRIALKRMDRASSPPHRVAQATHASTRITCVSHVSLIRTGHGIRDGDVIFESRIILFSRTTIEGS